MEPGEALSTAAQIAVALAGFAGVVVVFRTESVHDWSRMDKFRLRLLLSNSILPLAFCMFGLLLLTIKPPPAAIWRWCSGFASLFLFLFAATTLKAVHDFPAGQFHAAGAARFIFYPLFVLGTGVSLLQLYNATILNAFWAFFAAIVVQLVGAMLQFVRLILIPRQQESDPN